MNSGKRPGYPVLFNEARTCLGFLIAHIIENARQYDIPFVTYWILRFDSYLIFRI